MRKVIYSIEGNIGSGKSTLLKALMGSMNEATIIPQPVDCWQHVGGYNLLDKYYEDPVRWGYTFQINCILSRMNQLSKTIESMKNDKVYISQRSVQSDKFIFAKLMHRLNKLNDMEYHLYLQMFKSLEGLFNKHSFTQQTTNKLQYLTPKSYISMQTHVENNTQRKPGPIEYRHIYLKTSAQKCFERIKKRNRVQERNLEFSYIKQLDNLHDQWLIENVDGQKLKGNNLVLDGQREFETDKNYLNELINRIKSYIVENSEYPASFEINSKSNKRSMDQSQQQYRLNLQARNTYTK